MRWFTSLPVPIRIAGIVLAIAFGALAGRVLAAMAGANAEPLVTTGNLIQMIAAWAIICVLYYVASLVLHRMMRGIDE